MVGASPPECAASDMIASYSLHFRTWLRGKSNAPSVTAGPKRSYRPVRLNWSGADGTRMGIPLQKKDPQKALPRALRRNPRAIELVQFKRPHTLDKKEDRQTRYVKASYPTFRSHLISGTPPKALLQGDVFFPRFNYAFLTPTDALPYRYRRSRFLFPINSVMLRMARLRPRR